MEVDYKDEDCWLSNNWRELWVVVDKMEVAANRLGLEKKSSS
jgi:RNA polymerase subunit RPABC4/transcription elongation factor Spt4